MWREADQALLERIEDELVLERLWAADTAPAARDQSGSPRGHAGGPADRVAAPHARAAGMVTLARALPGGPAAAKHALGGQLGPLHALLRRPRLADLGPGLLHHLALYEGQLAAALGEAGVEARVRSIAAWVALAEEGAYVARLAAAVAGGALPEAQVAREAAGVVTAALGELGRQAREGARARTPLARAAMRALARAGEAARIAGAADAAIAAAVMQARSLRDAAIDEALAPLEQALAETSARGDTLQAAPAIFEAVAEVWRWADADESVERFAIERIAPVAWEVYRVSNWEDLRRLLAPIAPLVDRLADRIEQDRTRIAYAGPCAQVLVFRSEAATGALELELAERAVRVCPTHRNGRIVLANALCDAATRSLDAARWGPSTAVLDEAAAQIERALRIYPDCKRAPRARERLDQARARGGWVRP